MVTLSNATSASPDPLTMLKGEATATIQDDDDPPSVMFADAAPTAEEDGSVTLTVMLSAPSGLPIVLDWTTADATGIDMYDMATADVDYTMSSGVLSFEPAGPGLGYRPDDDGYQCPGNGRHAPRA